MKGTGEIMDDVLPAAGLHSMARKPGRMDRAKMNSGTDFGAARAVAESSDEQLMTAFSRGSNDAFTELFTRYKQPLFGFFWRRVADRAQAEELTQETFVAVIRAAPRYEQSAQFRTFLYAIALKILRAFRRKAAFRATFLGSPAEHVEPSAESGVVTQLLMREALRKLDAMDREILMLREFEQLSYAEIAELLHLPVNTVRSRLFRARAALRELLLENAPSSFSATRRPEESI
jgi:RNA polymerase sigma-70 factor (ECF subfamily)